MVVNDIVVLIGAVLGLLTFIWTVLSWFIALQKNEPKTKADTFHSLAGSIEKLNTVVKNQSEMLDQLNDEIFERDGKLDQIVQSLRRVEIERDQLKSRIDQLEQKVLIRDQQARELQTRLRSVENERDSLLHRIEMLESENENLKKAIGKRKF